MMRRLALSASLALVGCAGTVDWSEVGVSPAELVQNSAEVVACDKHVTAVAAIFPNANRAAGTPEWRAAMRQKMGMFDACMRAKGWHKIPVVGWQKTRPLPEDRPGERGGD